MGQKRNFHVPWPTTTPAPGPLGIVVLPLRYRDSCGGICAGNCPVNKTQAYFQRVLNLELQLCGEGLSWTVPPPPCRSPLLVVPRGVVGDRHLVNPKSPRREVVRSSAGAGVIYPPFLGSFA